MGLIVKEIEVNENLLGGKPLRVTNFDTDEIIVYNRVRRCWEAKKVADILEAKWEDILSTIVTFSVGDSDGDGNGTKITVNDTSDRITIDATDITLTSSAVTPSQYLFLDALNNVVTIAQLKWIKGADIASAIDLGIPTDGNYFDITGTTTIETFDNPVGVGSIIAFQFDDILTIQNHATIKLPGGVNITTQAGDVATFIQDTTTSYKLIGYQRQDGTPLAVNIVNDTTPQLGGDLDLNGKNIDFPTTANISDCVDEDDMASDSATKLVTQQSCKAYADTKLNNESGVALLSAVSISFLINADTTIYTVPTGKRCVLHHAVIIANGNVGTTDVSIGQNGTETDFIGVTSLANLDAQFDAVILSPVPSGTPSKIKSYAAGTVIQAQVTNAAGAPGSSIELFGYLY